MGKERPRNFYDRYKGKFPYIIDTLMVINNTAIECGLGELFLNGQKEPKDFGGCDECSSVKTYQASATSKFIKINDKVPMVIEIERGFEYKIGGNSDYFINFRIQAELLNSRYDEFMDFFDRCFSELTGTNYNLVLSNNNYINLIYVPLQRQGFSVGYGDTVSSNPLVWLVSTIVGNGSGHMFYIEGLPADILSQLSDVDMNLIESVMEDKENPDSELYMKLMDRLKGHSKRRGELDKKRGEF